MAAPVGNRFALGNEGGRPAHYDKPEDLYNKIIDYFKWVEEDNKGRISITGLCLYLGFESRKSLFDYEEREEFSTLIKRARLAVENYYEEKLTAMSFGGSIFALKNMNAEFWKDKTEQEVKQTNTVNLDNLSADELNKLLEIQKKVNEG